MEFDKGRAKPIAWNTDIPDDSLEAKMQKLGELKAEKRDEYKAYEKKVEHISASIKSLEAIIKAEVMELKQTVCYGNIRAEYIPQVVIKMKKEKKND